MSSVDSDVDTWHCCDNVPVVVNIAAASLQLTYPAQPSSPSPGPQIVLLFKIRSAILYPGFREDILQV